MNYIEDYRISQYRQMEIEALRRVVEYLLTQIKPDDIPRQVKERLKDADMARNEIKKIEEGRVSK